MKKCFLIILTLSIFLIFQSQASSEPTKADPKIARQTSVQQADDQKPIERKVVFHLSLILEERLALALSNIKNLFKAVPYQQCKVHVVANGEAVKLFKKDKIGPYAKDIEELHKLGVVFSTCWNAMAKHNIQKSDLFQACEIVPAGITELIDLQAKGYAYIKP